MSALEAYVAERIGGPEPPRFSSIRVAGQGMSDDTILVDAIAEGRRHALAIRRYRPEGVLRSLSDPHRHYRTLRALEQTSVPAPRPLWYDPVGDGIGGSTIGMERLDGFVPVPWSPAGRKFLKAAGEGPLGRRFVELLAEIHAVDWRRLGLGDPDGGASPGSAAALVDAVYDSFKATQDEPEPILVDAFGWLRSHLPPTPDPVLVHGDYRTGNLLFADGAVTGVLDWEVAQPGDPMRDLAWVLAPSNRMDTDLACYILPQQRVLDLYEEYAGRAADPAAIRWWQLYHQVSNAVGWINAASTIRRGLTTDLRMLRWSYTLPTMRRLVLDAFTEIT